MLRPDNDIHFISPQSASVRFFTNFDDPCSVEIFGPWIPAISIMSDIELKSSDDRDKYGLGVLLVCIVALLAGLYKILYKYFFNTLNFGQCCYSLAIIGRVLARALIQSESFFLMTSF